MSGITFPAPIQTDFFVDVNVGEAGAFYDDPEDAPGPHCVEFRTGHTIGYATEEAACAVQRAWRLAHGRHPITAQPLILNALTETQLKALDWGLTCLIEQTAGQADSLEPDQAVEEICDLASLVELLPPGDTRGRMANLCEEIRREQQTRLDATLAQEAAERDMLTEACNNIVGFVQEGSIGSITGYLSSLTLKQALAVVALAMEDLDADDRGALASGLAELAAR